MSNVTEPISVGANNIDLPSWGVEFDNIRATQRVMAAFKMPEGTQEEYDAVAAAVPLLIPGIRLAALRGARFQHADPNAHRLMALLLEAQRSGRVELHHVLSVVGQAVATGKTAAILEAVSRALAPNSPGGASITGEEIVAIAAVAAVG